MASDGIQNGQSAETLLNGLYKATSAAECHIAADALAAHINAQGLRSIQTEGILDSLIKASKSKKVPFERVAGAIGLSTIFSKVGGKNAPNPLGAEPWLLSTLIILLDLYADKADSVRDAADGAVSALMVLPPAEAVPEVLAVLYDVLENSATKWQSKVGALKIIGRLSDSASEQIGEQLVDLIPHLKNRMSDTKTEVRSGIHLDTLMI
jgi:elongation factor 3